MKPAADPASVPQDQADTLRGPDGAAALPAQALSARVLGLPWGGFVLDLLLVTLLWAGIALRFSWTNWNQGTDLHPDEYGLTGTLTRLSVPDSLGDYFNTRLSLLSPYQKYDLDGQPLPPSAEHPMPDNRMRWGQWPITLIRWTAEATGQTGYGEMRLWGRKLSALADTLALFVVFVIGRRLYGQRVGLLAAALSSLAVMQIQQSHFMTVDNFAVLFTALSMYCAVRVAQAPQAGSFWERAEVWYGLFGAAFGMAMASRVNLLPLFGIVVAAAVIAYAPRWERERNDRAQVLWDAALRLGLAGVVALLTFRVTQPMSFRAETGDTSLLTLRFNPEWVESMRVAQAESNGIGGGPPGEQWTNRPALIFPFVNMVLWGMGLPLGLVAWAGFVWALWRAFQTEAWRVHLLPLAWVGGYFLFMGTRWVKSVRYFLPIYPFLILLGAWAIFELWHRSRADRSQAGGPASASAARAGALGLRIAAAALFVIVPTSTLAWAWGFTGIYRQDNTRIQASHWIYRNVPGPINLRLQTPEGTYAEPLPLPEGVQLTADAAHRLSFEPRASGSTLEVFVAHARNVYDLQTPARVRVLLSSDPDGQQPLAQTEILIPPAQSDLRGEAYTAALGPAALQQGQTYYLFLTAPEGGPVSLSGATLTNENWDEGLPLRLDGRDAFGGLYRGLEMSVRWQDNEDKRQMFLSNLSQVDYIILPSQRGLWSASRLPNTYPLTMEYYRALFDGRLGFDLAAQFTAPIVVGPLHVSDLVGTLAWGRPPHVPVSRAEPFNNSLLAAEEAFSVYDHAPVWIFKKRADFSLDRAAAVLYGVDLNQVVNQGPRDATKAPTLLMLPPERLAQQRAGGTWSDMFDAAGLLNRFELLGVVAWWLAVLALGWLAFPLTHAAFGGLADRGYTLAKTVALLVVAWLVWVAGSLRLLPFTRGTILLAVLALALLSGMIAWRRREALLAFWRAHRHHIWVVEGLTLALFAFDLLIRLGNPDLWHPFYGGEKPMVLSFFNAVLKSVYFPPYDPWLAGGYINYYYYGFVIVGLLTKLLGIIPAFAYNLILPTLFALLGINAFSVAYNLIAHQRSKASREPTTEAGLRGPEAGELAREAAAQTASAPASPQEPLSAGAEGPPLDGPRPAPPARRLTPNPYLAGVAAALLVVVLGNLGQVRTFLEAFQRVADHGALEASALGDNEVTASMNGAWRVLTGQATLSVGLGNWYWDATRIVANVISEQNGGQHGGEITEFPFFTFLYADLHAHMMDMPLAVLAVAWAVSYLLEDRRRRSAWASGATWFVGGLALGVTRATNTWDFPTYLALGAAAVAAAEWFRDPRLTRPNLLALSGRVLLVAGLAMVLYQPFDQWFASPITKAEPFKGIKTPLEPYLYMFGLFLFVFTTWLVRESRRWLAETPATILSAAADWLTALAGAVVLLIVAVGFLLYLEVAVSIVAVPLMAWAGLLLLRSRSALSRPQRAVLFLLGTGLALTLFVDLYAIGGDRMNTIFKLYIQVWILFSVGAGAALAWVWAEMPQWTPRWRGAWTLVLSILVAASALYTVTAANAKIRDRFPQRVADASTGCAPIPGMALPAEASLSLAPSDQPRSLNGMDYMQWSAYCDRGFILPLAYDHEAVRWMQDNVAGSPVIAEAQSFDLYRLSSRYAWNTGLPDVVGWDWHQRQERGAVPTGFITQRGYEVTDFYTTPEPEAALTFITRYDVRYIVVGPMERAYYPPEGLAKFEALLSRGQLTIAHQNPGVTIYAVQEAKAN